MTTEVRSSAIAIQQVIEEMSLVEVFCADEESMVTLGNVTLRDLLTMWLDNQELDQYDGGDHEAEIAEVTTMLAAMQPFDVARAAATLDAWGKTLDGSDRDAEHAAASNMHDALADALQFIRSHGQA